MEVNGKENKYNKRWKNLLNSNYLKEALKKKMSTRKVLDITVQD